MKFHKRQLILASLVVALSAAVYLNWQFSDSKNLKVTNMLNSTEELGEAKYVNSSNVSDKSSSNNIKKYFTEAQINRQKARDESQEKLKSLINTNNLNPEIKEKLTKDLDNLLKNIQSESNIENLIKSKNFTECLAIINNNECNIIVNPGTIDENSVIIIKDIVTSQTEIPSSKIKIIEAKIENNN